MSVSMIEPALAELYERAGASDKDREAWLAERRAGVTATEMSKIMTAGSRDQAIADLVKIKRDGDSFTGNVYTEWGVHREPVIVERLIGYGVTPESRVFRAKDNPRFLASPDGLSVDFDGNLILDEIKTSGVPLPKGSAVLDQRGYVWQMMWQCFVTGAIGVWLNVEQRLGEPGNFSVGEFTREYFPRDDAMIAELVKVAELALAAIDSEVGPVINEEVDTNAVNYLRAVSEEKAWAVLKKKHYDAIVAAGISQESPLARVTVTPGTAESSFEDEVVDLEAAAAAHPKETAALARAKKRVEKLQAEWDALANQHTKKVTVVTKGKAARATITAGKGTKK